MAVERAVMTPPRAFARLDRPSELAGEGVAGSSGSGGRASGTTGTAARARWSAVQEAVAGALDRPVGERAAFLADALGGDDALRAEAERLVRACEQVEEADGFLSGPAAAFAEPLVADVVAHGPERGAARAAAMLATLRTALAGRYAVERELGRGGMATVYLAHDARHDRPVAIKVLHPWLAMELGDARFAREIAIAARLQHPHVLTIHDSGVADGLPYYVMPYVDGESLRARLARDGARPLGEAVRLLRALADALAYAHERGIVHRDVKPENILLSRGHPWVADFGIAKALADATATTGAFAVPGALTGVGVALGTPAYMAPEQLEGAPVDPRADLYALGIVAHELLTGRHPYGGRPAYATPDERDPVPPPLLAGTAAPVPGTLATLVRRLLAWRPADRPQSAAEVVHALDAIAGELASGAVVAGSAGALGSLPGAVLPSAPVPGGPPATPRRAPVAPAVPAVPVRERRRRAVLLGLLASVALAGGAWWTIREPAASGVADGNGRVVVFPLEVTDGSIPADAGEDVATWIGNALDGTEPLRWIRVGTDTASPRQGNLSSTLPDERRLLISRELGAGFYIDGAVARVGSDSLAVRLRLHDAGDGAVMATREVHGARVQVAATELGIRALAPLLVRMLAGERRVDLSALVDRDPVAIIAFLEGDRAYRTSRFAAALAHYQTALARDSQFALAAVSGAQAASWLERADDAAQLARIALTRAVPLPTHRAAFARGIAHHLAGRADSAIVELERAIAHDSLRSEPWMALGEVYRHRLPRASHPDARAEAAYRHARRVDSTFTPPLFHLAELALRRRDLEAADTLARAFARVSDDTVLTASLALPVRCARGGVSDAEWARVAATAPGTALQAGLALAGGGAYPRCARAAFQALLDAPRVPDGQRWAALYALTGVLVATGRDAELGPLFASPAARDVDAPELLLLAATAGADVGARAESVATELGGEPADTARVPALAAGLVGGRPRARRSTSRHRARPAGEGRLLG
jgi:serine/threonine-protein kinase